MNLDPDRAPKRPDLQFLTVRSARTLRLAASAAPAVQVSSALDLEARGARATPAPLPTTPPPSPARQPGAPPPAVSYSLDLDERSGPPRAPSTAGTTPPVRNPIGHIGGPLPGSTRARTSPGWERTRLPLGGRVVLRPSNPAVTLSRLSSGIGTLSVHAAVSPALRGDIVLSCAYELVGEPVTPGESGQVFSSVLAGEGPTRSAPSDSRRPVLVYGRDQFQRIAVDLRQVRQVRRLLVLITTQHGGPIDWAGTLILGTHGGARLEIPLDELGNTPVGVVLALFQVDGELVARAELERAGSVREACLQFGYDTITWIDAQTPLA